MPKPVTSKADFVRRYQEGEFGNRAPTWDSLNEWFESDYSGPVHVRNRVAGGKTFYSLWSVRDIERACSTLTDYYISAMAPHFDYGTAQGEVQRSVNHLDLTITTGKVPMREALLTDYTTLVQGLRADMLLRHFMDPPSYEWLQYLLDAYVDHVVEFSCFSRPWGTVPDRNTVVWEVRAY